MISRCAFSKAPDKRIRNAAGEPLQRARPERNSTTQQSFSSAANWSRRRAMLFASSNHASTAMLDPERSACSMAQRTSLFFSRHGSTKSTQLKSMPEWSNAGA
jgi:hypothetical protein